MADLLSLLSRGYFPKELPPPFKTVAFGHAVAAATKVYCNLAENTGPAKLGHHNLARPGNIYRRLGIPNPTKHVPLCYFIAEQWNELETAAHNTPLSLSSPTPSPIGRALNPAVLIGDLAEHRITTRAGKRHLLTADVTRFYPSIYTHSIPWALHTKAVAKANKSGALTGNALDKLVRQSQDAQTIGIPIGPDTSLLIAELVMAAVDREFTSKLGVSGYRYIDDFEFAFSTAAEADAALGPLQESLSAYELALNPTKTQIDTLPAASEEVWLSKLRDFRLRPKPSSQRLDVIKYFDLAFSLAREFPNKTVLNYAVAKLRSTTLDTSNIPLVQDLILQSVVNEPGVTRFGLEMLIRYRAAEAPLDVDKIANALATIINHHAPLGNSSEVAWALWGAIAFKTKLDEKTVRLATVTSDAIVTLLALDAHERGLVDFDLPSEVVADIGAESLASDRWLLLYEGVAHGWLPEHVILTDEFSGFFDRLMADSVLFYDSDVELSKIERPLDELHGLTVPVLGFVFGY